MEYLILSKYTSLHKYLKNVLNLDVNEDILEFYRTKKVGDENDAAERRSGGAVGRWEGERGRRAFPGGGGAGGRGGAPRRID